MASPNLASRGLREVGDDEPGDMHSLSRDEIHEGTQSATFAAASVARTKAVHLVAPSLRHFGETLVQKLEPGPLSEPRRGKDGGFRALTLAHGVRLTRLPCGTS